MTHESSGQRARRIIIPLLLFAGAGGSGAVLLQTPPQAPKGMAEPIAAVVGVAELLIQNIDVKEAYGTIIAARWMRVQPEVTGRVIAVHSELIPGGLVKEGDVLFEIDPRQYEIAAAQAEADLDVARLEIERLRAGIDVLRSQANQVEAELEFLRWNSDRLARLSKSSQASQSESRDAQRLASREAALAALQAQIVEQEKSVASARASADVGENRLAFAKLDLSRTKVLAPINAIILDESVELGQLVGPQSAVVTLVATDEFWVEAGIPVARLADIRFAGEGSPQASEVTVPLETGGEPIIREGVALRRLGELDPQGRMARALFAFRDPLQRQTAGESKPRPILLASYVLLAIDAGTLIEVISIPTLFGRPGKHDRSYAERR